MMLEQQVLFNFISLYFNPKGILELLEVSH